MSVKFEVAPLESKSIQISIKQDEGDVNILANGERIAFFDSDDGILKIDSCSKRAIEQLQGVSFTSDGYLDTKEF